MHRVKILILTQYYPPETGAPQNRLSSLAKYLKEFGNEVEVLTAIPHYPKYEIFEGYKRRTFSKELIDGIPVYRGYIYITKNKGLIPRVISYFSFTLSSYFTGRRRLEKPDVIICESPPLFLGISAVLLKRKWKSKLVFNVSDLWPESAEEIGLVKNKWILKRSYKLANWIYKNADLVSGQTQGIINAINLLQPGKKLFWLPNGIDPKKFADQASSSNGIKTTFNLLYAGIIGHAQGLEVILHAAKLLNSQKDLHFYIVGDGPVKEELKKLQTILALTNVTFIPNQPSHKIAEWLAACDAYIVPLKKLNLFKGAIPSKLFEPLYFAKPILLGVDGEAKELFVDKAKGGLFFEPENAEDLAKNILHLYTHPEEAKAMGCNGKRYVEQNFQRENIARKFADEIHKLM